jgi:hypothetical protein
MANQQVIISVLADVSKFSKRMRGLGDTFADFGRKALIGTAVVAGALGKLGYDALKAAEEAQVADNRLNSIAESMGLFGSKAGEVSKRLQDYAAAQSLATGIDDEAIKATQAKLLTFGELAKSADVVNGAFDRATNAAIDLAAAGFGDAESNATQLGKALQDPVKGLTALTRVGVTFTDEQKKQIEALVEANDTLGAQEIILSAIEGQVGGTAEATAKSTDKIRNAFEEVSETIGTALLPYVEDLVTAFVEWLQNDETIAFFEDVKTAIANFIDAFKVAFEDPAVKDSFERLNNGIKNFFEYLASPEGKKTIQDFANMIVRAMAAANEALFLTFFMINAIALAAQGNFSGLSMTYDQFKDSYLPTSTPASRLPTVADRAAPRVTVNVSGITPLATTGRTVMDAINNASRLGVRP